MFAIGNKSSDKAKLFPVCNVERMSSVQKKTGCNVEHSNRI